MSDPHAALLADALNKYFCGLVEEIPTKEFLDDDDIIKLRYVKMELMKMDGFNIEGTKSILITT
ncbi:hypothetical protein RhiirA5_408847 [Rhizophagus irregularis]|uniref:Uncharacterized protein n=1 Tax=Rhizophagus irregularis TaxID=588596 RepID=A0A2I1FCZ3_9GLOM|nr:hypothetical protein RhiirA5_433952 [Rhizophagus irregularis]PKB96967.1 hypothetical protein RhiirA5_433937 [Rhizophagus irregularis]PKC14937.1 hypothetical protein RhiirA5_408847 [Rhizophagus irregularis]PKY32253.1 hypothetical protein RhiirB3_450305 [Rhizophagus irregularis]